MTDHTIFGAGPAGLYAAWRLITGTTADGGPLVGPGDTVELVEWGNYAFTPGDGGTRRPAGRICSHHYDDNVDNSYIEVGGMRFIQWTSDRQDPAQSQGHQLVTKTIHELGLDDQVVPFLTTDNPLYYLRGQAFYQEQLPGADHHAGDPVTAPYNTPGVNEKPPGAQYAQISRLLEGDQPPASRTDQCAYYSSGVLPPETNSVVYNPGDTVSNIGYWNFFYDQSGNEGYQYANDGGGYAANLINWNAANAAVYNDEFAPGGTFKTLRQGYSQLFEELFRQAAAAADRAGVPLVLTQQTRLHSIWLEDGTVRYVTATAENPDRPGSDPLTTDHAFLAMPRHAIELVAGATRFQDMTGKVDFLNDATVANYIESVIKQPSYKIAMFFDSPWWETATYPPRLADRQTFGPTITDLALRQVYYFGDNAPGDSGDAVYGLLASYDDMQFTAFWHELELGVTERNTVAGSRDLQPLEGARAASAAMVQMLRLELAKVHWGDPNKAWDIPEPLETVFMDWGGVPFGAGYHAWAPHFDIGDVMQRIRTPTSLAGAGHAPVYIVGSAYSNDQAWVEGAFATVESVLTEFFDATSIADPSIPYPFVCRSD